MYLLFSRKMIAWSIYVISVMLSLRDVLCSAVDYKCFPLYFS